MKLSNPTPGEIKIVVLDRGFVFVGHVSESENFIYIDKAMNIRKWGTSDKGLGELRNGPLQETILDSSGTVRAPMRALILTIDCIANKWTPFLK